MKSEKRVIPYPLVFFLSFGSAVLGIFLFLILFIKTSSNSIVFAYAGAATLYLVFSLFLSWVQVVERKEDKDKKLDSPKRQFEKWRIQ